MSFHMPEKFRVKKGMFGSDESYGNNGAFAVLEKRKTPLFCLASDGMSWEHVSVSTPSRCPTWKEMCVIKSLFWDEEDVVIQYHPQKSEYIDNHPYCLHLWRPIGHSIPIPPNILVGFR